MDILNPQQTVSGIAGGGEVSLYQYFVSSPLFAGFVDLASNERKIFMSQYATLPSSLKTYLASTETSGTILATSLEFSLDDNQTSAMAESLRKLILGEIFIKDFPTTISSKLGIDDIKAGEIVNKIVSASFGPIIEDVKRIQRTSFPYKVMALQKEAQPPGLSPRPSVPEEIKGMPLTQPGARQDAQSVRPPTMQPPTQPKAEPVANLPAQPNPLPPTPTRPEPSRPPLQMSPPSNQPAQPAPEPKLAPKEQQFKMPDLGSIDTIQQGGQTNQPGSGQNPQKSLEEELEKVANVIDLRTTEENKNNG